MRTRRPHNLEFRLASTLSVVLLANYLVGTEPWLSPYIYGLLWLAFLTLSVGYDELWRPGPASWLIIHATLTFGLWPFFQLSGEAWFSDSHRFFTVLGYDPELNPLLYAGILTFLGIVWALYLVLVPQAETAQEGSQPSLPPFKPEIIAILLGIATCAEIVRIFNAILFPPALVQPGLLLRFFFPATIAVLLIRARGTSGLITSIGPVMLVVLSTGMLGFAFSGLKGTVYLPLFFAFWLIGSIHQERRIPIIFSGLAVLASFYILLPAFQHAKHAGGLRGSPTEIMNALAEGTQELIDDDDLGTTPVLDNDPLAQTWEYFGRRLLMLSMTRQYHEVYEQDPLGPETYYFSLQTVIPRILYPDKPSSDQYFNELAIRTGIGNKEDTTTSRKPSFIEEAIAAFGPNAFIIGGLLFGLYIVLIERLLLHSTSNADSLFALRYCAAPLGQLPNSAAILGGASFAIVFIILFVRMYLDYLLTPKNADIPYR